MFVKIFDARIFTKGMGFLKKCCKLSIKPGKAYKYFEIASLFVEE
jgi:hypothetical protein